MTTTAPTNVATAIRLMWIFWLLGTAFVALRVGLAIQQSGAGVSLAVMALLVLTALALLIRAVSTGHNWARIVYSALAALASFLMVLGILRAPQGVPVIRVLLTAVLVVGYVAIIWLLFRADSSTWFKRDRASAT